MLEVRSRFEREIVLRSQSRCLLQMKRDRSRGRSCFFKGSCQNRKVSHLANFGGGGWSEPGPLANFFKLLVLS